MPELNLDYPYWFLAFCIITGIIYSYLLYTKKSPWSQSINKLLAGFRFAAVAFLIFLLLNPFLKQLINEIEKPIFIIGIDNSTSMLNTVDSIQLVSVLDQLNNTGSGLKNNFDIEYRSLSQTNIQPKEIVFNEKVTDLNSFFRNVQSEYESRNLAGILLASDGNYNTGVSPSYFPYGFKIFTLGIGDTTIKKDVVLKNVLYNKIAYQGNKFPVVAEIVNRGFENQIVKASVRKGNKILDRKEFTFTNPNGFKRIDFEISADQQGINHYVVDLRVDEEEAIIANNRQDVFIDVIEGKQKILILAPSPHPDIKAIQSVISNNDNYELDIFIPNVSTLKNQKYDLVIVHQYYDRYNITKKYIEQFKLKKTPILHIIGQQSNEVLANNLDPDFTFKQIRNQSDKVGPTFNPNFTKFTFDLENNVVLSQFPTIDVPYGEYQLTPDTETILFQKVGSIVTNKPLLYVKESNDVKVGYLLGDGFWQWRLQEYALNENSKVFDELFSKLIQYLSTKADKRKFRVNTSKTEYSDNESILFTTEVYNDIYERIYGDDIQLTITNDNGLKKEYSFVSSSSRFEVSGLPQGIYSFEAVLSDQRKKSSGKFVIKKLQLELLDQSANYSMLKQISKNTEGNFYNVNDISQLSDDLQNLQAKGVIHTNEDFFSLINLKWLFFIILVLISTEWFVRKYSGGY